VLLPYIRKRLGVLVTPAPPGAGQLLTFCVAVAACACFQMPAGRTAVQIDMQLCISYAGQRGYSGVRGLDALMAAISLPIQ
jgi:hypothetical protein